MTELLYFVTIATYTLRSLFFVSGAARERRRVHVLSGELPPVSVVVPARNEELNIVRCIESLAALNYPADKIEIIVVNDRSTDSTGTILSLQQMRFPQLKVITIHSDGEKNLQGKAGALECGIRAAHSDFILMTDADCVVHTEWARSHVAAYSDERVGAVCAYTLIDGETFFARLQAVEWTSTHTMASAAVYYKQYLGCYGNNMSVRRRAYEAVGGYTSIPFSVTEDLALLQAITSAGFFARYLCTAESGVSTLALQTLSEYIAQHKRWAIGGRGLGYRAVLFVMTSAVFWTGLVVAALQGDWIWVLAILLARVLNDFAINAPVLNIFGRNRLQPYTVPAVLFFSLLELVLPFLLLDSTTRWKGQTFKS